MTWINREVDNLNIIRLKTYKLPIIVNINQLLDILCINNNEEKIYFYKELRKKYLYKTILIKKKNGGHRELNIPCNSLKIIQKVINKVILNKFSMSNQANAYIKKRSIVTNALPHLRAKTLIKIDIKDFFSSINYKHVYSQFRFFGYGENVSKYLALLCVDGDLKLPQGAPTSPTISNLICILMDSRIYNFCKKRNLNFTRYADDITISSQRKLDYNEIMSIKNLIFKIIREMQFEPNLDKFKFFYSGSKLQVTGVVVNDKLSVPKEKIRELDNAIRYISKYGLKSHLECIKSEKNNYINHLYGLAYYIKMINTKKGENYLNKLNNLIKS